MILIILLFAIILITAAIRGTQNDLFSALKMDIPGYAVWAAAIVAVGAIGVVPGLKPISRGIMALVIIVILVHNYSQIISGFENAFKSGSSSTASDTTDPLTTAQNYANTVFNQVPSAFGSGAAGDNAAESQTVADASGGGI